MMRTKIVIGGQRSASRGIPMTRTMNRTRTNGMIAHKIRPTQRVLFIAS
ncbi:MAG: hypothetical protein ACMUHU_05775 [Thermoplasmatota archaeon]